MNARPRGLERARVGGPVTGPATLAAFDPTWWERSDTLHRASPAGTMRTNTTLASFYLRVRGTRKLAVRFSYAHVNPALTVLPASYRVRRRDASGWRGWSGPLVADGVVEVASDLPHDRVSDVQVQIIHPMRVTRGSNNRHRETLDDSEFLNVEAILADPGARFGDASTVPGRRPLRALIFGDSKSMGTVHDPGSLVNDFRAAAVTLPNYLLESLADSLRRQVVVANQSWGLQNFEFDYPLAVGDVQYQGREQLKADYPNVWDSSDRRWDTLTNHDNPEGVRSIPARFVADVVIVFLGQNDQIYVERREHVRDHAERYLRRVRQRHPGARVVLLETHTPGGQCDPFDPTRCEGVREGLRDAALRADTPDGGSRPPHRLEYVRLSDAEIAYGSSWHPVHPTAEENRFAADYVFQRLHDSWLLALRDELPNDEPGTD